MAQLGIIMSIYRKLSGNPNRLIAIVGPTASGKTALAIAVAKLFNGVIICADSRTIYKNLNIGTAKPTQEEQSGITHYGLDLVEPNERFTAADFKIYVTEKVEYIRRQGKLPIIVGGSGLYIDGYLYDFEYGELSDINKRQELQGKSIDELHSIINNANIEMPQNKQNKRYLIRAIEQGGINRKHSELLENTIILGLSPGKDELISRIDLRAHQMLKDGVVEEAAQLYKKYGFNSPGASGNIYRALKPHFEEGASINDCMEQFKKLDWRLAKRQLTWFRRNKDIKWFSSAELAAEYLKAVL